MRNGAAGIDHIIEHVQRFPKSKRRTVQDAVNHNPAEKFIRLTGRCVAANPAHQGRNPDTTALTVIPDGQRHRPGPVLHQPELLWLVQLRARS